MSVGPCPVPDCRGCHSQIPTGEGLAAAGHGLVRPAEGVAEHQVHAVTRPGGDSLTRELLLLGCALTSANVGSTKHTKMKYHILHTLACGLLASSALGQDQSELTTPKQRVSYSIGVNIGGNLKRQEMDIDAKALVAGISDAIAGKTVLSEAEMREVMTAFQQEMETKMAAKENAREEQNAKVAPENLKKGEEFLAANAKKEGVTTTASGLQYKVLKSGGGKTPKATDTVKTHYHGTLIDGTVFDSSVERGEPVSFPVNRVIPGWTEALQLMKEGDKWQLTIPSKLAYGERGAGDKIGPNCTLVFEVELLSVEQGQ